MHFSTVVLPLALALTAASEANVPSKPLPAGMVYAREILQRDTGLDPEDVCGEGFDRCDDSFCCRSGTTCEGEINGIPLCKNPTATTNILGGTEPALLYDNFESLLTSAKELLSDISIPDGLPTELPDIPGLNEAETTGADGGPAATGNPQNAQETDNAARGLDAGRSFRGFGVVAVWGAALLGGAGWLLM